MAKCFSCGKRCHNINDMCPGCGKIVCVLCVFRFDHEGEGEHGHYPPAKVIKPTKKRSQRVNK